MTLETQLRVAQNLKALRKTAKLSQCALAANISICRSTYCQYEQGDRLPDVNTLHSLSRFYHVKMDTLINCDIQTVLNDYFIHQDYTRDETRLMDIYSSLSDFSKGRLLERAEEFALEDATRRRSKYYVRY